MTNLSFISIISELSNQWDFCIIIALIGAIAAWNSWTKRWTSGLLIPMWGLLVRKIFLFVPVCGALSTSDRIIFWSIGAYVYLLLLILLHPLLYLLVSYSNERDYSDDYIRIVVTSLFLGIPGLLIGSAMFLPVDGWSHAYMPVVSLVSCLKIVFVSPALLPACWIGIILQFVSILALRNLRQSINAILIVIVLITGLSEFIFQSGQLLPLMIDSLNTSISETVPIELKEYHQIRKEWRPEGDIQEFIAIWAGKLESINRTGVNVIETDISNGKHLSTKIKQIPSVSSLLLKKSAVFSIVGTVLLILFLGILSERSWFLREKTSG